MKKIILPILILSAIATFGQSIELIDAPTSVNAELTKAITELHFGVKNTSSDTVNVIVAKEIISEIPGTFNYFCWGPTCLTPAVDTASAVSIAPGDTNNSFIGYYDYKKLSGTTKVKYTFWNKDSIADKIEIIISYVNGAVASIAGDINSDGKIGTGEICGDIDNDGKINNGELLGDVDGDKEINNGERAGDANGDMLIAGTEVYGDSNGDGAANYTGIKNQNNIVFQLSPNPVKDILNINYELNTTSSSSFRIYDILGNQILEKELTTIGNNTFNVFNLNTGIYFYTVSTNNTILKTEKFIISK